jgi:hypothetical protein
MLAPDCSEEFRQASMRRRSGERGSLRFPPACMEGFAGYSYYLRGRIALRRVPAEVYYGYRFHDDAVHAVAEVVTDRKRRPNGKPQPPWRNGWGPGTQGRLSSEKRHETIYWKMTILSWSKKRHPTLIPLLSGEAR